MPAPVIIDFIARGMPDISRAFRSVEDTITKFESRSSRASEQGAKTRQRSTDLEAKEKIRAYQKADAALASARRAGEREADRGAKSESRATERAAREKVQAMLRADRSIAQSRAQGAREAERIMRDQAKAESRNADAAIREAKRAADGKAKEVARGTAYMSRVRERSIAMADRYSDQQTRGRERDRAEAGERRWGYARAAGAGAMQGFSTISRGAASLAGTVAQLGGGFSIGDALSQRVGAERQAAYLSNKSTVGGAARTSTSSILNDVKKVSAETGTDQDEVIKAWSSYVDKTGDFVGGKKNVGIFAKIAKATGASVTDVATSAGQLAVQNKKLKPAEMQQMLLDVVSQGRQGSVDMPELAKAAGKITKSSSSYAGSQTDNQRSLLGLSQIAMRTSGSPEEAATVLTNISADAMKHNGAVTAALGKGTFNDKGQIASSPEKFIADVMGATGGNLTKIGDMKFGARSMKMFSALAPTFNDAETAALAKGASKKDASIAGKAAVLADMQGMIGAKYTEKDLDKDFSEIMKTSAEQFEGAVRLMKTEIGEKLVPELVKLVPLAQQLVPPLSKFLDEMILVANWASGHPFLALTGFLTASVVRSVAEAKIGEVIKNLLTGGGGGGVPVSPGAGGAPSVPMGFGAGALVLAGTAIQGAYIDQQVNRVTGAMGAGDKQAATLTDMANTGDGAGAAASFQQAQKQSSAGNWAQAALTGAARASAYLNPTAMLGQMGADYATEKVTGKGPADVDQMQKTITAQQVTSNEKLIAALDRVTAAAAKGGGSGLNNPTQPITNRQPAAK